MSGRVLIRGDLEERHVTALGGAKGTPFAEMYVPFSQCLIAVVCGCFPSDGGREYEGGSFTVEVKQGFLSFITQTHIRQVALPSAVYQVDGRLYKKRKSNSPDLTIMVTRQDGVAVALLKE